MKNKEKYIDKIIDATLRTNEMCMLVKNAMMCECGDLQTCTKCKERLREWLEEEYKEPIKLTDDEKAILRNINKEYKWICRESDGDLSVCKRKPFKDNTFLFWDSDDVELDFEDFKMFNHLFQFIKWSDNEPYSIEELLKNG